MSHTNLLLGHNWEPSEWPDHVDVSHEGTRDGVRYVPELGRRDTCTVESSHRACGEDETWYEVELSCGHAFTWDDVTPPDYCPYCGKRVVSE